MLNLNFQNGTTPALNARNMNAIVESINTMQTQLANPFTFKGSVSSVANLPSSGNTINDTYYVTEETCLYTWDGDSWEVSSLRESDYLEEITDLKNDLNANIVLNTQSGYKNFFPALRIINDGNWKFQSDGSIVFVGATVATAYPETTPIDFLGGANQRYTLSFDYYTEQNVGSTGNGVYIGFLFSDGTTQTTALSNEKNEYFHARNTSTANKTIIGIYFRTGTSSRNIFHIKNLMLAEGTQEKPFIPYYIPVDVYARDAIKDNNDQLQLITQPSANIVDADFLLGFANWTKSVEGDIAVYSGPSLNIAETTILSGVFEENAIYTASFEAYTDQETVTSGNGFRIYFDYTDGTTLSQYVSNDKTDWTLTKLTSKYGKTISVFKIALAVGAAGNTWHIRKFQITKGNMVDKYVPYVSARDTATAEAVNVLRSDVFRTNWWNNGRIRLAMHQGMRSGSQPVGNCELSFRTAGINKAWAIETDIRKTSDGHLVCFHDQSVDALTDGTGNVADLTYAQIRELHYVSQTTGDVTDQIVPTFEEYLQICKTYNCVPLIEFKFRPTIEDCEEIVGILNNYGISGYMFIADILAVSSRIRAVTDAPLFQIVTTTAKYSEVYDYIKASSLRNCGFDFDYMLGDSITAEMVSAIHRDGMFCGVYTSNNADSIKNWFSLGVDIVTSDWIADLTT